MFRAKRVASCFVDVLSFVVPIDSESFTLANTTQIVEELLRTLVILFDFKNVVEVRRIVDDARRELAQVDVRLLGHRVLHFKLVPSAVVFGGLVLLSFLLEDTVEDVLLCYRHGVGDEWLQRRVLLVVVAWLQYVEVSFPNLLGWEVLP